MACSSSATAISAQAPFPTTVVQGRRGNRASTHYDDDRHDRSLPHVHIEMSGTATSVRSQADVQACMLMTTPTLIARMTARPPLSRVSCV